MGDEVARAWYEIVEEYHAKTWSDPDGAWVMEAVLVDAKSMLGKKRVTYSARLRIDDASKQVRFGDALAETGVALAMSGASSGTTRQGFGGAPHGRIKEKGIGWSFEFDRGRAPDAIAAAAAVDGCAFDYVVGPSRV